VLNGDEMPTEINGMFIVLIPKIQNHVSLIQFRPISLCIVVYKIILKALTNRLKRFFQTSSLKSNQLLSLMSVCTLCGQNRFKKNAYCALKLGMMKAYDRVELSYLEAIILKLGFHKNWGEQNY
jgi:hypothetical protein